MNDGSLVNNLIRRTHFLSPLGAFSCLGFIRSGSLNYLSPRTSPHLRGQNKSELARPPLHSFHSSAHRHYSLSPHSATTLPRGAGGRCGAADQQAAQAGSDKNPISFELFCAPAAAAAAAAASAANSASPSPPPSVEWSVFQGTTAEIKSPLRGHYRHYRSRGGNLQVQQNGHQLAPS